MNKRPILIILTGILFVCTQCGREGPDYIRDLMIEVRLPDFFKPGQTYAYQEVVFTSSSSSYLFETDANGNLSVDMLIPDIYTINTSWTLSGKEYKEISNEEMALEDKARVLIHATLTNVPLFSSTNLRIDLDRVILKELLISKVYFSGTKDNANRNYVVDSYVELFNNSDEVVYVDGKYLALAESRSPAAYLASDNPDYIYTRQICLFPGNGTDYPVAPGKSLLIAARSARDHTRNASNSVDLSQADFEVKDTDGTGNPDIKALPVYSSSTALKFFNLIAGGPNALFLFETDEEVLEWPEFYTPGSSVGERFRRVPVSTVIDGVEVLKNNAGTGPNLSLKRLQPFIDAGFTYISATSGYVNESVERKVSTISNGRIILQDTNNSTNDFVVISGPVPGKYDHPQLTNHKK